MYRFSWSLRDLNLIALYGFSEMIGAASRNKWASRLPGEVSTEPGNHIGPGTGQTYIAWTNQKAFDLGGRNPTRCDAQDMEPFIMHPPLQLFI